MRSPRHAAVLLAAGLSLFTVPMASAAENAASASDAALARKYAPVLYLHKSETLLPMSAAQFIKSSTLRWHHDKCGDDDKPLELNPTPEGLGGGSYHHQAKTSPFTGCRHTGREYNSTEDIRPHESIVDGGEGMYLDFANSLHGGEGTSAPVYWVVQGKAISYWFAYGYSQTDFEQRPDGGHEGDWEHITVLLGSNGHGNRVYYASHNEGCLAGSDGGRPTVYVAKGSHASYPTDGLHRPKTSYGRIHDATEKGPTWDAATHLRPLANEKWYGYGGGWGEVGDFKEITGPQGPHPVYKQGLPPANTPPC